MKNIKLLILFVIFTLQNFSQVLAGWSVQTTGSFFQPFNSVKIFPDGTGFAVSSSGKIAHTTNFGIEWNTNFYTLSSTGIKNSMFFSNQTKGYIVGTGNEIDRTTNNGANWFNQVLLPNSALFLNDVFFVNENTGFLCGLGYAFPDSLTGDTSFIDSGVIFKTTNAGTTWVHKVLRNYDAYYSIHFVNATTGFIAGGHSGTSSSYGVVFKTTDGGEKFSSNLFLENNYFQSIFFVNENTGWVSGSRGKIYKTTNSGSSWELQNATPLIRWNSMCFVNNQTGWAVGSNGRILYTSNGGDLWSLQESGVTQELKHVTFLNENTGWISGHGATILFTNTGGLTNVSNISNSVPDKFSLEQNYPNPFNPNTTITYSIPKSSYVKLEVFDLTGKKVNILVNAVQTRGSYSVNFNAMYLSSGMYFYVLQAGDYTEVRKMVVVR